MRKLTAVLLAVVVLFTLGCPSSPTAPSSLSPIDAGRENFTGEVFYPAANGLGLVRFHIEGSGDNAPPPPNQRPVEMSFDEGRGGWVAPLPIQWMISDRGFEFTVDVHDNNLQRFGLTGENTYTLTMTNGVNTYTATIAPDNVHSIGGGRYAGKVITLFQGGQWKLLLIPGGGASVPTTHLAVRYVGKTSGKKKVTVHFVRWKENERYDFTRTMSKTNPDTWVAEINPAILLEVQLDGRIVEMWVVDSNLPVDESFLGYPIRVSTLRDGVVFSSQKTRAQTVWSLIYPSGAQRSYGKFRFMPDDTIIFIPGPGVSQ